MFFRGLEILGILLIMVYVGAIAMLFLFVIMLVALPVNSYQQTNFNLNFLILGILLIIGSGFLFIFDASWLGQEAWIVQLLDMGEYLYSTNFFFYVLLIGLLLVAILVGVLALIVPVTLSPTVKLIQNVR